MPRVPSTSPATGLPTGPAFIHTTDCSFVDNAGRTLLLRGVNLSGASKAPVDCPSYILDDFWEAAQAGGDSFLGRPLNIDDGSADVHLARLRGWGFNMLRFPVTWEAIEHEGPGKYDEEFLDYTVRVLLKCKEHGFRVFMDPHQDTWSRFSGGSGAPFWTLPACGLNPRNITATQSAILHCEYPLAHAPDPASLPAMVWSTNYGRLLSQTVFTLFFAGRVFAPNCIIDGVNIQDWLQTHYIEAMGRLADRIAAAPGLVDDCVIGWDSMNEPFEGLVGWEDLNLNPTAQGSTLKKGTYPTPAQSLRLGMGEPQTVDNWVFGTMGPAKHGSVTIDPKGLKVWADPSPEGEEDGERPDGTHPKWGWHRDTALWPLGTCLWAQHGVWDVATGYILRPDYFAYHPSTGLEVEFITDFWKPHFLVFARRIRRAQREAIMFVQPPVFAYPPAIKELEDGGEEEEGEKEGLRGRCAYSAHYYDGLTLVTRHWNWFNADALGLLRGKYTSRMRAVKLGTTAIRKSLQEQLAMLQSDVSILGPYPTLIGEIGTPFDMDNKRSYGWTDGGKYKGDYGSQEKALDASLNGCDGANGLNYTVWTFCPDDHSHEWGDGWNMEDLSLWSPDDVRLGGGEGELRRRGRQGVGESVDTLLGGTYHPGESQAVLLRKKVQVPPGGTIEMTTQASLRPAGQCAGASSTSLASASSSSAGSVKAAPFPHAHAVPLPVSLPKPLPSNTTTRTPSPSSPPHTYPSPYAFLTDGARAVRAFCRPYPVKTVGKPKEITFEIDKAFVRVVVRVRAEDRLNVGGLGGDIHEEEEELATELFLPLVHFGHARVLAGVPRVRGCDNRFRASDTFPRRGGGCLEGFWERWGWGAGAGEEGEEEGGTASAMIYEVEGEREVAPSSPTLSAGSEDTAPTVAVDLSSSSPYPPPPHHTHPKHPHTTITTDNNPHINPTSPAQWSALPNLLDIEVRATAGRWTVQGQTLKWWYDVPGEGEPEQDYTIEVRRRGGAIKVVNAWEGGEEEGKERVLREGEDGEEDGEGRGKWRGCCPQDGCTVM